MKIREEFITHESDDEQILIDTAGSFAGMVRSNKTAAFIVDCLKEDTTADQIIDTMCAKYDAPREVIARDVNMVIEKLKKIGAICE